MIRYETAVLENSGKLGFQASYTAKADQFDSPGNESIATLQGYAIGNLRIDYTDADRRYAVAAFVNNFTDTRYRTRSVTSLPTTGSIQIGRPLWAGVSLTLNVD